MRLVLMRVQDSGFDVDGACACAYFDVLVAELDVGPAAPTSRE